MEKRKKGGEQREHRMNRDSRFFTILAILVLVALLTTFLAISQEPGVPPFERRPPSSDRPGDIEFYYIAKTVISSINVTLLIFLTATYIGIYMKTHSEFSIGLMIFSLVLLLNALASNPLLIEVFGFRPLGLGPFAMLPDMFTCAALVILLYLTIKY